MIGCVQCGVRKLLLLATISVRLASAAEHPVLRELLPFPYSRYFAPNSSELKTSVLMLHGSEGGSFPAIESEATILASQGFAVLVYCYFDCGRGLVGPRQTLKDIDVSVVHKAAEWLRSQPQSNGKVVVYGFSRGAELALVAASLDSAPETRIEPFAVHPPSDFYNSYFN
ncbi:MAG: hypothetical protein FJW38_15275 [Acidobacteria bacterium]|nr:hypothetical protein [Acidobacteriota bacterium]